MKKIDIRNMFGDIKLVHVNDLRENEEWADLIECLRCHKYIRVSSIRDRIDITDHCECGRSKGFKSDLIRLIRSEL